MNLTIHTPDTAPEASKALLNGIVEDVGFLPNLAASIASSPALLAGFDGLRRALASGQLDPTLRETAGVATGVATDNRYGVAFHSTVLSSLGVPDAELDRMRAGEEPEDPRAAAVYTLARELVLSRGKVASTTIRSATAAGLSDADLLEVIAECTFAGLVGTIDNLGGRVELDEPLKPRSWHAG